MSYLKYESALYSPKRPKEFIDLSSNTNRFGAPPSFDARRFQTDLSVGAYPDPYADELRKVLAEYCDVNPENLAVGCGSDDLLNSAFRAFGLHGEVVSCFEPTFPMARLFAEVNRLSYRSAPSLTIDDASIERLLKIKAAVIYLCSPNNPTGAALSVEKLKKILDNSSGVVIVDEAYAEFAGQNFVPLTKAYDNLLILRTLSKAWGLASLRVGYAVGNAELVAQLQQATGPYKVSGAAQQIAAAVLQNDVSWMKSVVDETSRMRGWFASELSNRRIASLQSVANFLLVPTSDATYWGDQCLKNGLIVRTFCDIAGVGDAVRVTIAPQEELGKFLSVIDEVTR